MSTTATSAQANPAIAIPYQATIFLPGRFEEGQFSSPRLPAELEVKLGSRAFKKPQAVAGEGIFSLWPRTNPTGRVVSLTLVSRMKTVIPESEVHVRGVLLKATPHRLGLLIQPKGRKPFQVYLRRAPEFAPFLKLGRAYRVEGRFDGEQLIAERAWQLEEPPKEQSAPAPKQSAPAPKRPAPAPKRPPAAPAPKRPAPAPPAPAPAPVERPPALPRGQQLGVTGTGPYYLVLSPAAVSTWWPKVERMLPDLPRRYQVRAYTDGSLAVVTDDLNVLRVWYGRVRKS